MILSYQSIKKRCVSDYLITPWQERTIHYDSGMSYGLGPAGYDIRIREAKWLFGHGFALVSSIEAFIMPNDLVAVVKDKSTLARMGLAVQNTVIEPGWRGWLTLELSNNSERDIHLLANQPIAQIQFLLLDEPTTLPYQGKYQNQDARPVSAILEKD